MDPNAFSSEDQKLKVQTILEFIQVYFQPSARPWKQTKGFGFIDVHFKPTPVLKEQKTYS